MVHGPVRLERIDHGEKTRMPKMIAAAMLLAGMAAFCAEPQDRVRNLEEKLVAPCCWSESVAVHRSEIAAEMRAGIARMVAEGKTDREILNYYVGQYGKRILMEPEGSLRIWAYTIPAAGAIAGLWFVVWLIRRMTRSAARQEASARA